MIKKYSWSPYSDYNEIENNENGDWYKVKDIENLLDQWAEKVLKKSDEAEESANNSEFDSFKYARFKGFAEGLRYSLAIMNRLEKTIEEEKKENK